MLISDDHKKFRLINNCVEKIKSSMRNKYCLFCRSEIFENHYCNQLETLENKILKVFSEINSKDSKLIKKEIMDSLCDPMIKDIQVVENIKNKILAYSL
jgi:hypothetical protein